MIRTYKYGLLRPTMSGDIVSNQISRAHKYYNRLIEIERSRREEAGAVMAPHSAELAAAERIAQDLNAQYEQQRDRVKSIERGPERDAQREHVRDILGKLREARAAVKQVKSIVKTDPHVIAAFGTLNARYNELTRRARAECGLYWGTYLVVEQAIDQARKQPRPPHFRRWDGGAGAIGVQLQGGLAVADALDGDDTRLRIMMQPLPIPGRGGKPRPRVRMRVGSDDERNPMWAEWPLILHRPLPENGVIKWARVITTRTAAHLRWALLISLEMPSVEPAERDDQPTIAVDLRWSRVGKDREHLRICEWCDSDGYGEELHMPPEIEGQYNKSSDLRSIRQQALNEEIAFLRDWRSDQPSLPGEFCDRTKSLAQWQSAGRLAALVLWWRSNRFAGDTDAFDRIEAWRRNDKHLWEWEANARRKALARRKDHYRVIAATLARTHARLVIERINLAHMIETPSPESDRDNNPTARSQQFTAAPGEFRATLVAAFVAAGKPVETVTATGPVAKLLEMWRERSGVEILTVSARMSRFSKLHRAQASAGSDAAV